MRTGWQNKLTGQVGEFLVCAELGRRGFIATSFAGNVPMFDVLATDGQCHSVPIQVKAAQYGNTWLTNIGHWAIVHTDQETQQQSLAPLEITNPNLIYVCVQVASPDKPEQKDRFFVLTKRDLQRICEQVYREWMEPKNWIRPKKYDSTHLAYNTNYLKPFENNWDLVRRQLNAVSEGATSFTITDTETEEPFTEG